MKERSMPETNSNLNTKKKTSLGRGLGSLLGGGPELDQPAPQPATAPAKQAPVIADEAQIWMLPIDRLVANKQQPRQTFMPAALKELSDSIKEKGILQPIVARRLSEREFEIIAGE